MFFGGGTDGGRGLEGRAEGGEEEGGKVRPREFFWDSIVLYVVTAIIGLATIDAVLEFVRGSAVECFANTDDPTAGLGDAQSYVNDYCSSKLPVTRFFPAFIVIHGVMIAAPHYLWLNHFGGTLGFFFQLVSSMGRLRENNGEYPKENFDIVDQLQIALTTYDRNRMYRLYLMKLVVQLLLTASALGLTIAYFDDFDDIFVCPKSLEDTRLPSWPLYNQNATCVFASLRFLEWIRLADIVLLALVAFGLLWSMVWSASAHVSELGHAKVAKFSFETGLASRYYIPKRAPMCCNRVSHRILHWITGFVPLLDFYGPRIANDLNFLIMKLYRSDGGLGYVFNEVQVLTGIRALNNNERRRLGLHKRNENQFIDAKSVMSDLVWTFEPGIDTSWQQLGQHQSLEVPDSVRGAVLGLATASPRNGGALCLSFGSPSMGFAHALGRVFERVGSINFHPYYNDPKQKVTGEADTSDIVQVVCSDDILTGDNYMEFTTCNAVREIWLPGITHGPKKRLIKTDFIVIGPIAKYAHLHNTTVNLFLGMYKGYFASDAVLLIMQPLEIAGKDVTGEFLKYTPPDTLFPEMVELDAVVNRRRKHFQWPPEASSSSSSPRRPTSLAPSNSSSEVQPLTGDLSRRSTTYQPPKLTLATGHGSFGKYKFMLYRRTKSTSVPAAATPTPATATPTLPAQPVQASIHSQSPTAGQPEAKPSNQSANALESTELKSKVSNDTTTITVED